MGRPKKRKLDGDEQDVVYVRMHDKDNMRFIQTLMLETKQPMREVIERMVEFARRNPALFKVPVRKTAADRLAESEARREARIKAKLEGEVKPA